MGQRKGYKQTEEHIRNRFENRKSPWINNPHPKGMLGKKHCEKTKKEYSITRKGKQKTEEHKEKIRLGHLSRGKGYRISKDGYKFINIARRKEIQEHRLIWIKYNGEIPKRFIIHHIDGDKLNNDIHNLQLLTNSEHIKIHDLNRERNELGQWK